MKRLTFVLLALIVLLVIPLLRLFAGQPVVYGNTVYGDAVRVSRSDPVSGMIFYVEPWHYFLKAVYSILPFTLAATIIPIGLGVLFVFLLGYLLKSLKYDNLASLLTISVVILSPFFIFNFTHLSRQAVAMVLILAGWLLLSRFSIVGFFLLISASLLGFSSAIAVLISGLIFWNVHDDKKGLIAAFLSMLAILLLHLPKFLLQETFPVPTEWFVLFLSDLGGRGGLATFGILLALVGTVYALKHRRKYYISFICTGAMFILSFFFQNLLPFVGLLVSLVAGYGFSKIWKRKWTLPAAHYFCLLVMFCGILFSGVAHLKLLQHDSPSKDIVEAFSWLRTQNSGNVLSDWRNGNWISYYSGNKVFLNEDLSRQGMNKRYFESKNIFRETRMQALSSFLQINKIKYVVITKSMLNGDVWERENQGMMFLLQNRETFKKVFFNDEVIIWEYLGDR